MRLTQCLVVFGLKRVELFFGLGSLELLQVLGLIVMTLVTAMVLTHSMSLVVMVRPTMVMFLMVFASLVQLVVGLLVSQMTLI